MNDTLYKDISFITVYAYHGDGGERGIGPIIGFTSTRHDAEVKAHNSGFYGGAGHVAEHQAIKINCNVFLLARPDPIDLDGVAAKNDANLKASTLANLTTDQKRVLGLL